MKGDTAVYKNGQLVKRAESKDLVGGKLTRFFTMKSKETKVKRGGTAILGQVSVTASSR